MSELDRLDRIAGFEPFYDEDATRRLLEAYYQVPHTFDDNLKSQLFDHATFYKLPIEEEQVQSVEDKQFNMLRGIKGLGEGFLSGFSTFNVGEYSENEYERIMRSVGELAGFIGFVPAAPFKAMKAYNLARAAQSLRGKSVPMYAATKITEKVAPIVSKTLNKAATVKNSAYKDAASFLTKEVPSHIAEGAFHLGLASSIGSWQLGVNEMLKAGLHGGVTGGVFRGIANLVNKGGIPKVDGLTGRQVYTATQREDQVIRSVASSLYEGLQSSYRGETTPEQIYHYLLGAYFGANETTAGQMRARKVVAEVEKQALVDAKSLKRLGEDGKPYQWDAEIYDPKRLGDKFTDLPADIKESVYHQIVARHGTFSSQGRMVDSTLKELEQNFEVDIEFNRATDRVYKRQVEEESSKYEGKVESAKTINQRVVSDNPEKLYIVDDTQTKGIKGKENVLTVPSMMDDANLGRNKKEIADLFKEMEPGQTLVVPEKGIANQMRKEAPETYKFLLKQISKYVSGEGVAVKNLVDADRILPPIENTENTEFEMSDIQIQKKARAFVNEYLPDITKGLDAETAAGMRVNAEKKVYNLLEKYPKIEQYDDFVKATDQEFKKLGQGVLTTEAKEELRNMFVRKTGQKEVLHFTYYGGQLKPLDSSTDPRVENRAGKSKAQAESPKIIDDLLYQLTGETDGIRKLDHIVIGKDGRTNEVPIKELDQRKHWFGWGGKSKKNAQTMARSTLGEILKQARDQGYYYNGGKGDSGNMYFYKWHPEVRKMDAKALKDKAEKIAEIFGEKHDGALDHYKKFRDQFVQETSRKFGTHAEMREYFDRSFVSNIMWDKSAYGISDAVLKKHGGFEQWVRDFSAIQNAKGFNKRNQIWLTDGFALDVEYFNKEYNKRGGYGTSDGKAKFRLFKDADVEGLTKDDAALLYGEATDGAILVEANFLDTLNKSFGLPNSGQNKSFIVDNDPTHGAMLGKFMFHKASEKASEYMRKEKIHMLVPDTASKESGSRNSGNLKVNDDFSVDWKWTNEKKVDGDNGDYTLNLSAIKGSLSEKQTSHMLQRQMIPKQLMANLVPHAKKPLYRDTMNNFFDEVIKENYMGEADFNKTLDEWMAKDPKEFNDLEQEKVLKELDKAGLPNIIDALKNKYHHDFVTKLYQKILKSNTEAMHQDFEAGDIGKMEYMNLIAEARHYTSALNRMMEVYPDVAVFLHKDVRNYLQAALRNYVVNQVIRPKWDHSISVRMRGYDPWLAKEFPDLGLATKGKGAPKNRKYLKEEWGVKNADELFMLDNKFRDILYKPMGYDKEGNKVPLIQKKGKIKLGDLWDQYASTKELRAEYPEIAEWFQTISLRVPMDSISGAHKLQFAGFTGIDGHGAVFHPRTMRALGGADLDGDKAFVMFGMKKEWKDMYHDNKYEYMSDVMEPTKVSIRNEPTKNHAALEKKGYTSVIRKYGTNEEYGNPFIPKYIVDTWKKKGKDLLADGRMQVKDTTEAIKRYEEWLEGKHPNVRPEQLKWVLEQVKGGALDNAKLLYYKPGPSHAQSLKKFVNKERGKLRKNVIADNKSAPVSPEGLKILKETLSKSKHDKEVLKKIDDGELTFRDLLTTTNDGDPAENAFRSSPIGKYTTQSRMDISKNASLGRDQLGPAVTSKQILNASYNAMIHMPVQRYLNPKNGKILTIEEYEKLLKNKPDIAKNFQEDKREEIIVRLWKDPKKYKIYVTPRTTEAEQAYSRELSRAQIGFGSDPLDELGLTGSDVYFNNLWHSMFKVDWNGNQSIKDKFSPNRHARQGMTKIFTDFNQAYFSRNHTANRRWYAHEILEKAQGVKELSADQANTMLPRMVELLEPLNYSDDLLRRVDPVKLENSYRFYEGDSAVKMMKLNREFTEEPGGLFGRVSFASPGTKDKAPDIYKAIELNLHDPRERAYYSKAENFAKIYDLPKHKKILEKALPFEHINGRTMDELVRAEAKARWFRSELIDEYYRNASYKMQSDAMDRTSATMTLKAVELARKEGTDLKFINRMAQHVESVKRFERNRLKAEAADNLIKRDYFLNVGPDGRAMIKEVVDLEAYSKGFATQEQVDRRIQEFKLDNKIKKKLGKYIVNKQTGKREYRLTDAESYLYDQLMLSSFYKGRDLRKLDAYKKAVKADPGLRKLLDPLIKEINMGGSGTYFHKTGMKSNYIFDTSIKDFLREYSKEFRDVAHGKDITVDAETMVKDRDGEAKSKEHKPIDIYENELEGIYNIKERLDANPNKELTKNERIMVDELAGHLNYYHNSIGTLNNLNILARGLRRKNFDSFTKEDFRVLNRFFTDLRTGNQFIKPGKLTADGLVKLAKRHWMLFPRAVSKELMIKDFSIFEQQGRFQNYNGDWVSGVVGRPTHTIEQIQYILGSVQDRATKLDQDEKTLFADMMREKTGYESIRDGLGEYFAEVATARRDLRAYKSQKHKIGREQYHAGLPEVLNNLQTAKDNVNWNKVRKEKFTITIGEKPIERTGQEIVDSIDGVLHDVAIQKMKWIRGGDWHWDAKIQQYIQRPGESPIAKYIQTYKSGPKKGQPMYHNGNISAPKINLDLFIKDMMKKIKTGEPFDMELGLDNLRKITNHANIERLISDRRKAKKADRVAYDQLIAQLSNQTMDYTNYFKPTDYHPHFIHNKSIAKKAVIEAIDKIKSQKGLGQEEQVRQLKQLIHQYKNMTGEWMTQDLIDNELFEVAIGEIAEGRKGDGFNTLLGKGVAPNMMSRSTHLPGWDRSLGAWDIYQKNLTDTYFRQMGGILSRKLLQDFNEKTTGEKGWNDPEISKAWSNYIHDFIQRASGFPTKLPNSWTEGKEADLMNVKGTPYSWFADNHVVDMVNRIKKKMGYTDDPRLPKELRGVDEMDIRHWSNLEAKYQMATLLAHPKSSAANIFGGTLHTLQSVGWRAWRNARNVNYLKTNLPGAETWTSKKDIDRWVIGHGVVPDFILYEAGLNPAFKSGKWKAFMEDAKRYLEKDSTVKDETLISLAKKHKITEAAFQKAAWFMREPERALRRDSFVAHYLQARELYGHAGMKLDDPMLIHHAKKGVQATQFLYSAPYRPAFSATALGKVMTRFQTWAWNSVRFRKDVFREAKIHGFREGTQEFERFKRQWTTDMFVLALGNVFAFSLFESAMPAPYNWYQDTAEWILGDDKERDRAFFGQWPTAVAPLQMVTPPGLRMAPAIFSSMVNNDYSRLSEYYIWTMFPFGRMARDMKGIVENPMRTIEKTTGIPYQQFATEATKYRPGGPEDPLGKRETNKLAKQYPWVNRALTNKLRTDDNESVRTAVEKHPDHGWIVFPTIRLVDGKLKKMSVYQAKKIAVQKGDFIPVDSVEEGNRISKGFSARLSLNEEEEERNS